MILARSEALDLFHKWDSEKSLLRCDFTFVTFRATLRGRVRRVSEEDIAILSDDDFSILEFPLTWGLDFAYEDPGGASDSVESFDHALVMLLPSREAGANRDMICFLEINEGE